MGPDSVAVVNTLDNLGRTTESRTYANATYESNEINVGSALLRAHTETSYDERGRVYESTVHEVGDSGELTTGYWYDELGRTVKTEAPDGLIQKTAYTGFGAVASESVVWNEALGNAGYVSVTEYEYDDGGRPTVTRLGTAPGSPGSPNTIVSQIWYDADHGGEEENDEQFRVTGVEQLKPGSDSELVLTKYDYDDAGRLSTVIQPPPEDDRTNEAVKTVTSFDLLGRETQTDVRTANEANTLLARSRTLYDEHGRLDQSIQDEVIDGEQEGNATTYYDYDDFGRVWKVTDPAGAYVETTYDRLGNVLTQQSFTVGEEEIDYLENVYHSTTGRLQEVKRGTEATNAVTVTRYWYDKAGTDQGRLTAVESLGPVSNTSTWVKTEYEYDGFGRQNVTITPDPDGEDPLEPFKTEQLFDSAGRLQFEKTYRKGSTSDTLVAQTEYVYGTGQYGGLYLTEVRQYEVDGSGNTGAYLATKYNYGDYARVVKVTHPGGSFTKTAYSLGGDVIGEYLGTAEGTSTEADDREDDTIVEQAEYQYDNLGNVILTTSYQRYDDATGDGELIASNGQSRVSYTAAWFDGLGRMTDSADYGTGDGIAYDDLATHLKLDDGSGDTAADFSGQGAEGELSDDMSAGSPWVEGKFGGALDFDGSTQANEDEYVTISSVDVNNGTGEYNTVSLWIKRDSGASSSAVVFCWGDTAYDLYITSSGYLSINTGNADHLRTGNALPAGEWAHVAAVFISNTAPNDENVKIYINGDLQQL